MILPTLTVTEIYLEVAPIACSKPDFSSLHVVCGKIWLTRQVVAFQSPVGGVSELLLRHAVSQEQEVDM